ncbi:unnamed protein product [Heligmosomoides polygyrus]|uniref:Reverse transcriptase domain-containing protein n=1 Tax=Heligmosomoides polygyrus TaxID=6339 RepID=A0A183FQH9_HELPZ|nr:unnamed protein product [Heligmosomoides polygyrus]
MRELEWEDMGWKVDGRQLHHLRFAGDIVLITPNISQEERMLVDFDLWERWIAAEVYEDDVHEERTTTCIWVAKSTNISQEERMLVDFDLWERWIAAEVYEDDVHEERTSF